MGIGAEVDGIGASGDAQVQFLKITQDVLNPH